MVLPSCEAVLSVTARAHSAIAKAVSSRNLIRCAVLADWAHNTMCIDNTACCSCSPPDTTYPLCATRLTFAVFTIDSQSTHLPLSEILLRFQHFFS